MKRIETIEEFLQRGGIVTGVERGDASNAYCAALKWGHGYRYSKKKSKKKRRKKIPELNPIEK